MYKPFLRRRLVYLYKKLVNMEFILLKQNELWGKSGLEPNKSSRAYQNVFKTKNQSHCLLRQFKEEKIQRVNQALYKISVKGLN